MKLLWICCYDSNYPHGAEVAMMNSFRSHGKWDIDHVDYRMCKVVGVDPYNVILRRSKSCDAILLQRGEGLDAFRIAESTQRPIFYFATEGEANEDQRKLLENMVGKLHGIFARHNTIINAKKMGYVDRNIFQTILPYNERQYYPMQVEKTYDVMMSGSLTPRRQQITDTIINEVNKWGKAGYTNDTGEACAQAYNMSRTVVNIHAYDVLDTETRIFEAMSTSSLLITEELADNLDDPPLLSFKQNDIKSCIDHIKWAKDNPDKVLKLVNAANNLAKQYTWAETGKRMLNIIESSIKNKL